ncbi:unnamed protein product, partial [marine sediment metagenome]
FHDKPEVMKRIIDVGIFESVLCQYNLLDRGNQKVMAYAKSKGLGVAVMGPVGGGRLGVSDILKEAVSSNIESTPELALRFVFVNKSVSVALSGMENIEMVEENARVASLCKPFSSKQLQIIEDFIEKRKKKEEIPCNNCGYCLPCPENVAIPDIFQLMNYYILHVKKDYASKQYLNIGEGTLESGEKDQRKRADACVECGECEEKCPQKIKIMEKLKETHAVLE